MKYCATFNIDGIDLDLEWQYVGNNYSGFALELADSCIVNDLTLTASLPGTYRYPEITDEALNGFQWINMMVYDLRGPWNPTDIGPHSPYYFAINSIYYWNDQGVTNDRLSLGIPFYGYDFTDTNNVFARTYSNIIELDENNAYYNQYGDIYYNGILLVKSKTQLAIDEDLAGVMIWELGQDHFSDLSLLLAIDEVVNPTTITENTASIRIYPNPTRDYINLDGDNIEKVRLYDIAGTPVTSFNYDINHIDASHLKAAMYIAKIWTKNGKSTQKLISKM